MFAWSSTDLVSDAVKKHAGEKGIELFGNMDESIMLTSESLKNSKPKIDEPFPITLFSAAYSHVEEIESDLHFLTRDNPSGMNEQQIIEHVQFYDYLESVQDNPGNPLEGIMEPKNYLSEVEKIRKEWTPDITINPIPRWFERAAQIRHEKNHTKALIKYDKLRDDISYFERVVGEAAIALDGWIQQQIDAYRGK